MTAAVMTPAAAHNIQAGKYDPSRSKVGECGCEPGPQPANENSASTAPERSAGALGGRNSDTATAHLA
jgi:hypothetical protein